MTHRDGHFAIGWLVGGFICLAQLTFAPVSVIDAQPAPPIVATAGSESATGVLDIDVPVSHAIVIGDGRWIASARAFRRVLAVGDYEVEIVASGYRSITLHVHLSAGETLRLRPQLERLLPFTPEPSTTPAGQDAAPRNLGFGGAGLPLPEPLARRRGLSPADPNVLPMQDTRGLPRPLPPRSLPSPVDLLKPQVQANPSPDAVPQREPALTDSPGSVEDAIKALDRANVAFNAPAHMARGRSQLIEAKLAIDLPPEILIEQLTENGNKRTAILMVGDRMIATLSGAAFDVSPSGPQQQFVSRRGVTTWTWQVTPKKSGTQYLMLAFDALLSVGGKEGNHTVRTLKQEIEVEVAWTDWAKDRLDWLRGVSEHLTWLWVTFLVPIGLWIWRQLGKRRHPGAAHKSHSAAGRHRGRREKRRSGSAVTHAAGVAHTPTAAEDDYLFANIGITLAGGAPIEASSNASASGQSGLKAHPHLE
jgi:hypothetical protein